MRQFLFSLNATYIYIKPIENAINILHSVNLRWFLSGGALNLPFFLFKSIYHKNRIKHHSFRKCYTSVLLVHITRW